MNLTYIIIDDNIKSAEITKTITDSFSELSYLGSAHDHESGLDLILESRPKIVFLEIDPKNKNSNLSLQLINDISSFLKVVPKIIITTSKKDLAFDAIQYGVTDYILKPVTKIHLTKLLLKIEKVALVQDTVESIDHVEDATSCKPVLNLSKVTGIKTPFILCIKSYGDYRYIDSRDITYFQADNNSTDIHLNNGEMITAFKTLKHFEGLMSYPFVRIHNSYIVNSNYISRIHTGNAICFIKNSVIKLPFSRSYKINIDLIIGKISNGNYLEI
ncbi:LytR/AlgR family response regulator transcription factor [Flavobacterium sp. 7A]|uniref:LytR/AlgR family response regulator transcription factor n=1 Tax=Flavobacterium sp. 7A TaxID=2940571 RepID=UPI002227F347|nr:LytTR family DNA-binding domain-containing protein [Flavobacterium sp. 7A]MCW2118329.1 DNA-binding LytR/AlgR family response regulator [Flavobacterium sp. 7A]